MIMMKKFGILVAAVIILGACSREVIVPQGRSLGVKEVYPAAGDFSVLVSTEGVWSVSSPEQWIHVPGDWFRDNHAIIVSYDSNESTVGAPRFNRLGHVIVKTYDGAAADTLYIRQQGIEPFLSLDAENVISSSGGKCYIPVYTNLTSDQRGSISCVADADWVLSAEFGREGQGISFEAAAGSGRECRLVMSFTDGWGRVSSAETTIRQ